MLGDTPYSVAEAQRLDAMIDDLNREKLDFVVHLGDIGSSRLACTQEWLDARKAQFGRIRHALVVVPGDNEWSDCREPRARLAAWRRAFCKAPLPVEVQPGEYCEHMRWEAAGFLFVTLHVVGSNNNLRRDPAEHETRMAAVHAWLDESAVHARLRGRTLVVMMQANPFIALPRDGYVELRERLIRLGQVMPGRVFLLHGDTHVYHDDEPLPGVRRLEVWGSPIVSWIRAEAEGAELRFSAPRYR
ncbi:MAG TPA: metallophosphoesterase [Burkholderiales bacterium]|nr:metallophosphoesterase [Burkholderiales bacterium]